MKCKVSRIPKTKLQSSKDKVSATINHTVTLETRQLEEIKEYLDDKFYEIDNSTPLFDEDESDDATFHVPSMVLRRTISILFLSVSVSIVIGIIKTWRNITSYGIVSTVIIVGILGFFSIISFALGISVNNENSKTYIVSLFSALVALVALIVTLLK